MSFKLTKDERKRRDELVAIINDGAEKLGAAVEHFNEVVSEARGAALEERMSHTPTHVAPEGAKPVNWERLARDYYAECIQLRSDIAAAKERASASREALLDMEDEVDKWRDRYEAEKQAHEATMRQCDELMSGWSDR